MPPVISRIRSTLSAPPTNVSVAPWPRAISSRSSDRSTHTIRSAPCSRAPATAPRPTRPAPYTTTVDPGSTPARVDRGAEAGGQPAGEHAHAVGRGVGADHGQRDLRHHRVLGERGGAHEVADVLAAAAQAGGAVGQVALALLLADGQAQVGARADAVLALAALGAEQRDHAVALAHQRHAPADLLDDARALVAQHGGRVARRVGAGGGVQVGVADAAGLQAHQHLALLGLGQLHLLDHQRLTELLQDCGAHLHGARD